VHEKALKRGWQPEERLNDVAWLCRACHSFVHRVAGHEELVREYYTVKRLRERDDVVAFAGWGGKVMWKAR
jgi:predicted HNH restriction endonuclease